uniref:Reverse transcriptase Ty1/copia-type domain-containing protein n=1 Tax=Fagus sylvatica TaxID=28930 RepID=A0A2N9GQ28_FAGSY
MGSTSGHEITHPITVILDGPTSYHAWSQNMTVFLKGRRLWRYVTGDIPKPVPGPVTDFDSSDGDSVAKAVVQVDDFEARLEEWESIQCRILSWFINTSVPAISSLLPRLETGQSISDYYSQTASMWEQLAAADPPLRYAEDIDLFAKYKDRRRFTQFMMGLREDFEPTRAALLSRSPLPSLDAAVKELISEENRRPHHHLSSSDVVLATPCPPSSSDRPRRICTYCQKPGHDITECYRKKKDDKRKQHQSRGTFPRPQAAAMSSAPVDDPVVTVSQLESMFHRYMSQPSPALSVTSGNKSWLLDSACCNHMTPHASHFSQKTPLAPSPIIYTADSSHMSDPLTGKLLGTSRKIGRLFELCNLQIPSHMVSSSVAATTTLSPDLWHSRLGHASLSRLQLLASQGHLGSGEAALTAVYTINRIPSPTTHKKSPFELLYGKLPDYSSLRVFGCVCFVSLPSHERNKLEPRSRLCCFLGYGISQKGFRCYDPISRRLRISRHVEFWEHQTFSSRQHFPFISSSMTPIFTDPSIDLYPDPVRDSAPPPSSSDVPSLVLSPAAGSPDSDPAPSAPSESPTDIRRSTRVRAPPSHLSDYHCYFALATLHEPHTYREASTNPLWQQAMADELDALHKTHTWDMTTLPPSKSAVGCKWVYKIKTRADGSVERYKARLVARGFTQEYGIDYEETFAPVAHLTSVRSLLAVAAVRHWPLFQMDVKNAFLNGDLLEEVYMQPPPGYPDSQNQVCRLRRALYGLKQAPRAWFAKFSSVVAQQGFTPSSYDSALFIRHTSTGITLILLYVDDMIITATFSVLRSPPLLMVTISLKAKYASDLLSKAGLTDSKTVSTPLELNVKLNTTDVLRILRYIKGTLFHGLHFSAQSSLELRAYADADWAGDPTDRRSTTAEYRALADATSELLWLRWLLADMGAPQTTSTPIHCDNRSAIHIAHNDVFHERTKHIEIDCHFIRHHLQQSALHLLSVSSEDQLADVFTKSHPPGRLRDLVSKLKMASSSPPCV